MKPGVVGEVRQVAGSHKGLTQEEIDALLAAHEERQWAGIEPGPDVVPFDFRCPEKMSKEHEQSLRMVQGSFARHMAGNLSTFLRSIVRVELQDLQEGSYENLVAGMPSPNLMAVCSAPPLEGKILFIMDPGLSLAFVDRLMGGQGDTPVQVRELTEIEAVLLRRVLDRILGSLRDAWVHIMEINPVVEQVETSPHYVQLVPGSDSVVAITFHVGMRTSEGSIRLVLPFHMLKPVIPKLHEHLWLQGHEQPVGETTALPEVQGHLLNTAMELRVELGGATISVAELLDLQVGDCVVLDTTEGSELAVLVADQPRLWGHLGVVGRTLAVSISRWDELTCPAIHRRNGGNEP